MAKRNPVPSPVPESPSVTRSPAEDVLQVDVDRIALTGWNTRAAVNEDLDGLVASIRQDGILQPLIVTDRPTDSADYALVAGERRLRAARRAGLARVPCVVRYGLTDDQVVTLMCVENLQRADLDPVAEARAIAKMIEVGNLSQPQAAERIGRDRAYVQRALRLLDCAPGVQDLVASGALPESSARLIAAVPVPEWQTEIAAMAVNGGHNAEGVRREIERRGVDLTDAPFSCGPDTHCAACDRRFHVDSDPSDPPAAPDPHPGYCSDPACYQDHARRAFSAKVSEFREQGVTVIEGKEADKVRFDRRVDHLVQFLPDAKSRRRCKSCKRTAIAATTRQVWPNRIEHQFTRVCADADCRKQAMGDAGNAATVDESSDRSDDFDFLADTRHFAALMPLAVIPAPKLGDDSLYITLIEVLVRRIEQGNRGERIAVQGVLAMAGLPQDLDRVGYELLHGFGTANLRDLLCRITQVFAAAHRTSEDDPAIPHQQMLLASHDAEKLFVYTRAFLEGCFRADQVKALCKELGVPPGSTMREAIDNILAQQDEAGSLELPKALRSAWQAARTAAEQWHERETGVPRKARRKAAQAAQEASR